tara:strand:+ start:1262 stop:1651 length:390 start_codon:yes stop_codon:yes gene_type:complete
MKLILEEILWRKQEKTPNKKRIQKLQQFCDKKKMTFFQFRKTGEVMKRDTFMDYYYDRDIKILVNGLRMLPNATDVIRYVGGYSIQVLPDKNYCYYYNRTMEVSKNLKELEEKLYNHAKTFIFAYGRGQ